MRAWWSELLCSRPFSQPSRGRELRRRLHKVKGRLRQARALYAAALRMRQEARSTVQLRSAALMMRRCLATAPAGSGVEQRARERLALMLCQERLATEADLDAFLASAGYTYRLCTRVLHYSTQSSGRTLPLPTDGSVPVAGEKGMTWRHLLRQPLPPSVNPQPGCPAFVAALDGALPRQMIRHLRRALSPVSPFWGAHGYVCDGVRRASPFFSYVHDLSGPPRNGLDRAIRLLQAHVAAAQPKVARAASAEWWSHCRPHATGHQLHFDSADEGRGAGGPKHPIASSALYLSGGT